MTEFEKSQNRMYQENMLRAQHGKNKNLKQIEQDLRYEVDSLREMSYSLKRQVEIAEANATEAKKEALEARREAKISRIISIVAIIVPVIQNLIAPYVPTIFQVISESLLKH